MTFAKMLLAVLIFAASYSLLTRGLPTLANVGSQPLAVPASLDHQWPPRVGQPFPNLVMVSHTGAVVALEDLRGKVLLVEPIGMTCPACNAFSGANKTGGYEDVQPQQNLTSIEELLPTYGSVSLDNDDLVLVQVLLYDMTMKSPSASDAKRWAEYFGFDHRDNIYVLAADERYINPASYDMIPGFFLIDRQGILQFDATGHRPKDDLYDELIPAVARLLGEDAPAARVAKTAPRFVMSVSDAYQAIPHARTPFDAALAQMSDAEREYLNQLFWITDLGVTQRVQTQMWLQSGGRSGAHHDNYPILHTQLDSLEVPASLRDVHQLITAAITHQQRYLEQWDHAGAGAHFDASDTLVRQSHSKLIKAYQLLMARFDTEQAHNQRAFYDHLCALDFI